MRRYAGREELTPESFRRPVVTIGMFDGLHRGHRHVIEHLRAWADELDGEAVVVTFETHPMAIIAGAPPTPILSTAHRLVLLERLGMDAVVLLPFDGAMRRTDYETFTREVLIGGIGLKGLLFGYNANFGLDGAGTLATVKPLGAQLDFDVVEAPAIQVDGHPISSTRIRAAIAAGDLSQASEMLGRPFALFGTVVRGDGRGRQIGFPTANVDAGRALCPPSGVYQVVATVRGERYAALANLGNRPTIEDATPVLRPLLEVHVPGIAFSFYDEQVEVEFVRKIRDEKKFPSVEALVEQIKRDVSTLG